MKEIISVSIAYIVIVVNFSLYHHSHYINIISSSHELNSYHQETPPHPGTRRHP